MSLLFKELRNNESVRRFFYNTSRLKKDFERIFNFPDSESICSIALLGGEPTLHPDFDEIVKFFFIMKDKKEI